MARSRGERRYNDWAHINRKVYIRRVWWGNDDEYDCKIRQPHRLNKGPLIYRYSDWTYKTRTLGFSASDLRKLAALESSFQEIDDYEPGTRPGGHPLSMRRHPKTWW